jgi:succinate-semialdehyde dehydrogenase/glutarate-semialdehyde dehydrogenase
MRHSAEVCVAANRLFVHEAVADDFSARLVTAMSNVRIGSGFDDGVTCGPMINQEAITSIDSLVRSAVADGATALTGGAPVDGPGFFYAPTVLGGVSMGSEITRQEIFGPVAPVIPFADHDQMITWANDTEMGLAAYVYSADVARAMSIGERIQAGMVGINRGSMSDPAAPFGGMKQSGLGREGAHEGIYEFCETQYIAADW